MFKYFNKITQKRKFNVINELKLFNIKIYFLVLLHDNSKDVLYQRFYVSVATMFADRHY